MTTATKKETSKKEQINNLIRQGVSPEMIAKRTDASPLYVGTLLRKRRVLIKQRKEVLDDLFETLVRL